MFTGEYREKFKDGKVRFPFDKERLKGWYCYLLEYDGGDDRFATIAENDGECLDGDVKIAGRLPLVFDGDMMVLDSAIVNHISLEGGTVVFCGTGKFIDIMSEDEFKRSLEFMNVGDMLNNLF